MMGKFKENLIGELIEKGIANLQTGPFGTMLNASEYSLGGIPVIAVQDIGENKLKHDKLVFVDEAVASRLSTYKVKEGDIIFGRKGAVERRALIKKEEAGWLQGSDCIRLRLDSSINSSFVAYQLGDKYHQDWLAQFSTGATMPSLNQEILKLLPLFLPPLPEQEAIAEVLRSFDNKIDLLHQQNETIESLAETLFRKWFVADAQDGWEIKSLAEIAHYLNGLALQNYRTNSDDSLPVIKIRELNQGITEKTDRCRRDIPEQYLIQDGDILFSWSGSLELVVWHDGEGALNQHLFKVTSDKYPKWFYYLATKRHLENFRAIAESKSTTMGHIQRHHLSEALIAIPSDDLFTQYGETLSTLIEKLIKNNAQIKTLMSQRDSLLPRLMSGNEVRVTF